MEAKGGEGGAGGYWNIPLAIGGDLEVNPVPPFPFPFNLLSLSTLSLHSTALDFLSFTSASASFTVNSSSVDLRLVVSL